jgi:hypothetical protein
VIKLIFISQYKIQINVNINSLILAWIGLSISKNENYLSGADLYILQQYGDLTKQNFTVSDRYFVNEMSQPLDTGRISYLC